MASPDPEPTLVATEDQLAAVAATLAGCHSHDADSPCVRRLAKWAKEGIESGGDPLGDEFCRLRTPERRRGHGAVYTPSRIVDAMVSWAASATRQPTRIVDPGAGSGRFLLAAGRAFPKARLVAVEVDPLARLLLEANAKVLGMDKRLAVLAGDYRSIDLPPVTGPTLFLGNPPYVRHHGIPTVWKKWFAEAAAELGLKASKLLIDQIPGLASNPLDLELLAATIRDEDLRTAFRYLAAPPVSEDDLKTLADSNLAPTTLRTQRAEAERVRDAVLRIIDPHRFGWLVDGRQPSDDERTRAVVASAVLVAVRKVETSRRGNAKRFQERAVKELLRQAGLDEAEPRDIPLLDAAPAPGQFCGESKLDGTRADIVVRLYDGRVMPIECKVSNSAVNSFKRINHEAAGKARDWISGFGRRQVVPAAVIAGVFNPANLGTAQFEGLTIYWNDRLNDLVDYIASTRG